jgi:hypothetical protein
VRHARPLSIGLNCSFGASQLRAHVAALSAIADTLLMAYPNAGLPNDLGEYDEGPEKTGAQVRQWAEQGIVSDTELIAITDINEAYERMLKSCVKYRFVIDMASLG